MSYSNSTLSSYSLVQELANNTRVIAPPPSAGETAGTFPRMQFTRFQDGMASPTN